GLPQGALVCLDRARAHNSSATALFNVEHSSLSSLGAAALRVKGSPAVGSAGSGRLEVNAANGGKVPSGALASLGRRVVLALASPDLGLVLVGHDISTGAQAGNETLGPRRRGLGRLNLELEELKHVLDAVLHESLAEVEVCRGLAFRLQPVEAFLEEVDRFLPRQRREHGESGSNRVRPVLGAAEGVPEQTEELLAPGVVDAIVHSAGPVFRRDRLK